MFCKFWQPGEIKTRWGAEIGQEQSARRAARFQLALARRFRALADRRALVFAPQQREPEYQELSGGDWDTQPQSDGDLGMRMSNCFRELDQSHAGPGAERVVIIGSDSPDLPAEFIQRAFAELETKTVVIGPAQDGGYYLIGANRWIPEIFAAIPWSTSQVFQVTCNRLLELQLPFAILPTWYDIDEQADWERFRSSWAQFYEGHSKWDQSWIQFAADCP